MSIADLDPVIHAPKRLAIMSVLATSTSTDFAFLRAHLSVSDSDLSKQMSALEAAGYVTVTKSRGRGGATSYRITRRGTPPSAATWPRCAPSWASAVDLPAGDG